MLKRLIAFMTCTALILSCAWFTALADEEPGADPRQAAQVTLSEEGNGTELPEGTPEEEAPEEKAPEEKAPEEKAPEEEAPEEKAPEDEATGEETETTSDEPCTKTPGCTLKDGHEGECVVESAETDEQDPASFAELLAAGGNVEWSEDYTLEESVTIPAGTKVSFTGCVTIPADTVLVNEGTLELLGITEVSGTLDNREGGIITVDADNEKYADAAYALCVFGPTETDPLAEGGTLLNAGEIRVYDALVIETDAAFSEDQLPITVMEGGSVSGSQLFIIGEEVAADDETVPPTEESEDLSMTPEAFSALFAQGEAVIESDILLNTSVTIPDGATMTLKSGTVTLSEGAELINDGFFRISGGKLRICSGALLKNNMFLLVDLNGEVAADEGGLYEGSDAAAFILDQSTEDAKAAVTGINRWQIDCSVFARSASGLQAALETTGYRQLTVVIDDPALVGSVSIPPDVAVSVR